MLSLILITFGLLLLLISRGLYGDFFSPLGIYGGVWFGALALNLAGLIRYYEFDAYTLIVLAGATIAFVLGCLVASFRPRYGPDRRMVSHGPRRLDEGRLRLVISVIFCASLVGFLTYWGNAMHILQPAEFWSDLASLRYTQNYGELRDFGIGGFLLGFNAVNIPLGLYYLLVARKKSFFVTGATIVCLLTTLSTARFQVFFVALWGLLFVCYARGGVASLRAVLLVGAGLAIVFVPFFVVLEAALGKGIFSPYGDVGVVLSSSRFPDWLGWLVDPYHYVAGTLTGLNEFLLDWQNSSPAWGVMTFAPILRIGHVFLPDQIPHPYRQAIDTNPFGFDNMRLTPIPINLYTWLKPFYIDFGYAGILLLPFLFGIGLTIVYRMMRRDHSFLLLFNSSLLNACLVFTIEQNIYTWINTWIYVGTSLVVAIFVMRATDPPRTLEHGELSPLHG